MIYLIFVQYTKQKMQITQELSEYDFMTKVVWGNLEAFLYHI